MVIAINAPNTSSTDDVFVYVGFSPKYLLGHSFIAVDGQAYTFSGVTPEIKNENDYVLSEIVNNNYFYYKYAIKYNEAQKTQLKNNLTNLTHYYSTTPYTLLYLFGIKYENLFLTREKAHNCTTFIADALPSFGALFDITVKSAFYPSGLGVGLDIIDVFSRGKSVERLNDI